ncbi:hypothetical protein Hanom_Chr12g01149501 [Helianthus anomalus]
MIHHHRLHLQKIGFLGGVLILGVLRWIWWWRWRVVVKTGAGEAVGGW